MFENIAFRSSTANILFAFFGFLFFLQLFKWISQEIKIRKLGGHGAVRKTWLPFGIDLIWEAVRLGSTDRNLEFWDDNFMNHGHPANPYTVEGNGGGRRIVFTADPENIKTVLATQFNDFGKGRQFHKDWYEFLGDSIFSTDHELWHQSRQLIRPQFVKDRVSDLQTFEKHLSLLMEHLGSNGQEVDLKDLFFRYTLDAATDFLLGRSVGSLENGDNGFAHAFGEIQRLQNLVARLGPLNFLMPRGTLRRHLKVLNSFVDPYIEDTLSLSQEELEKRTKSEAGYTFLHALASYTRDRKVLRDQLVAVLLAGRDTTACTLSWLFYELSRNPEIVNKLRKEIVDVVGVDRPPTYTDLKRMKYLQSTMNETLRLYPVVPFNVRCSIKDTTLPRGGGPNGDKPMGIPAGTPIAYSTHYMQLSSQIYPPESETFAHPLKFSPERWENWQPKPWTYIPFNGGPRICVGQQFALTEMGYTIVRILQRFERVESRMPTQPGPGVFDPSNEKTGPEFSYSVDNGLGYSKKGKSQVRQMADSRELKYKSEIVLMPAEAVRVAFY